MACPIARPPVYCFTRRYPQAGVLLTMSKSRGEAPSECFLKHPGRLLSSRLIPTRKRPEKSIPIKTSLAPMTLKMHLRGRTTKGVKRRKAPEREVRSGAFRKPGLFTGN